MRFNRMLLSATLVVVALVIQVSVLARLHLPGAVPDLVLLTVLALAMVYGHVGGALIGFAAGLLADLAPPADHAAGRYAQALFDERDLFFDLLVADLPAGAHEILAAGWATPIDRRFWCPCRSR